MGRLDSSIEDVRFTRHSSGIRPALIKNAMNVAREREGLVSNSRMMNSP